MASSASMAQATGEAASAAKTTLEEIIVTAERRSEDIQKTAASVSVRLGDDLGHRVNTTLAWSRGCSWHHWRGEENSGNADIPGSDNVAAGLIIAASCQRTCWWQYHNDRPAAAYTSMMSTTASAAATTLIAWNPCADHRDFMDAAPPGRRCGPHPRSEPDQIRGSCLR
jgi:hypothetical protein